MFMEKSYANCLETYFSGEAVLSSSEQIKRTYAMGFLIGGIFSSSAV